MKDGQPLARAFKTTVSAIGDATVWTAYPSNARKLAQDRGRIERILRRSAMEARRLERTFEKPTCRRHVGPSQAGKSYLISVLARKEGEETMMAKFDGRRKYDLHHADQPAWGSRRRLGW